MAMYGISICLIIFCKLCLELTGTFKYIADHVCVVYCIPKVEQCPRNYPHRRLIIKNSMIFKNKSLLNSCDFLIFCLVKKKKITNCSNVLSLFGGRVFICDFLAARFFFFIWTIAKL